MTMADTETIHVHNCVYCGKPHAQNALSWTPDGWHCFDVLSCLGRLVAERNTLRSENERLRRELVDVRCPLDIDCPVMEAAGLD